MFFQNIQSVLNRRLTVPMAWAVSNVNAKEGVFRPENASRSRVSSLHGSLFVDYQVEDVPGFGTLDVAVPEARPEALEAALDPSANVTFFRIKNSWGGPTSSGSDLDGGAHEEGRRYLPSQPGYNDLYTSYLDLSYRSQRRFLLAVTLPNKLRFPFESPRPETSDDSEPSFGPDDPAFEPEATAASSATTESPGSVKVIRRTSGCAAVPTPAGPGLAAMLGALLVAAARLGRRRR